MFVYRDAEEVSCVLVDAHECSERGNLIEGTNVQDRPCICSVQDMRAWLLQQPVAFLEATLVAMPEV